LANENNIDLLSILYFYTNNSEYKLHTAITELQCDDVNNDLRSNSHPKYSYCITHYYRMGNLVTVQ